MDHALTGTLQPASALDLLWLEITGKCNLTCSHCYAESGPRISLRGEMGLGDWMKLIDEAAGLGCRAVTFIGGEPTLHPDLPQMIARAKELGIRQIEVYTNATHLSPGLIESFRRHGVALAASFYSADPTVHEEITGVVGSWRRTVEGLQAALAADLALRIGIIEMPANQGRTGPATEFLKNLGIRQIHVDRVRGVGRAGAEEADGPEKYSELCGRCSRGRLCVTSTGEAFPCVFSRRTRLGNARLGLSVLLSGERLQEFKTALQTTAGYCEPSGLPHHGNCEPDGGNCEPNGNSGGCEPNGNSGGCEPNGNSRGCEPERSGVGGCEPGRNAVPCEPGRHQDWCEPGPPQEECEPGFADDDNGCEPDNHIRYGPGSKN